MTDSGSLVADLHVHTTASDGRLAAEAVPDAARRAGLDVVAVTDHDRVHPDLPAPVQRRDGIVVVRGVELRVDAGDQRVDLLGYAVERTDALDAELRRIQRDRIERAERIIDCVESRLDVSLDLDPADGIGRPHIARAIDDSDADYDYGDAFEHLIGADCPCYVPRSIPDFETGVDLLSEACAFVGLAHPFRYSDVDAALALLPHLDAVERHYPYDRSVPTERLDEAIEAHGLLATGGSDAHGTELGGAGLDEAAFERLKPHFPSPETES
jgi:predicted metal-dependent phosphoesterase TrpH